MAYCTNCGEFVGPNSTFCGKCGEKVKIKAPGAQPPPSKNEHPMAWYNFLIYFGLFFEGITGIWTGIEFMTGNYAEETEMVYSLVPFWKVLDVFVGVFVIIMGIYAFVIRQKLANREEEGVVALIRYYQIGLGVCLGYAAFVYIIVLDEVNKRYADEVTASFIPIVIVLIAVIGGMILANKAYFDKRKDFFIY